MSEDRLSYLQWIDSAEISHVDNASKQAYTKCNQRVLRLGETRLFQDGDNERGNQAQNGRPILLAHVYLLSWILLSYWG